MVDEASRAQVETRPFQAEVNEVLHLVIHSLYSHKEIFLRELVSNASDALEKLRFRAITEPSLSEGDAELGIRILPDPAAGTLTIEDNGIGMSHDDLARDLGTVARSGSRAFLDSLAKQAGKGEAKDVRLIGQFGVGFYSAYLVADRVEVISRAAGSGEAWKWESDGRASFTLAPAERAGRGTSIVLHLKSDQKDLLEPWRLKELVTRYSDFVTHPIHLVTSDGKTEQVNRASALWRRPKSEITDEQYDELYRHLAHEEESPIARAHFKVEGASEFTALLFVPRAVPFEMRFGQKPRGVRLFVKRVLVMESCEELLPAWLRFVVGVVDSDDLPLNVSREILQESSAVRTISKQIVRHVLDALETTAKERPEDFATFWRAFGPFVKEGIAMDRENRDRIAATARWETTKGEGLVSLDEYFQRMPLAQPAIYWALGEKTKALAGSPHLEGLKSRGWEVLLSSDPIDELGMEQLRDFKGKPIVSAMRADLKLTETDEERRAREKAQADLKPLLDRMKEVLGDRVSAVRVGDHLEESPCCLVLPTAAPHAFMERVLREAGRDVTPTKRILEVNPKHPIVRALEGLREKKPDDARLGEWIEVLHDQALLTEGSTLEDPTRFARRVNALLAAAAEATI